MKYTFRDADGKADIEKIKEFTHPGGKLHLDRMEEYMRIVEDEKGVEGIAEGLARRKARGLGR